MTIQEARRIFKQYAYKSVITDDEEFMLIEALEFLINETKDSEWMVQLGGYYYDKKQFDLALKYYEMADSYNDPWAPEGLGYIWYYGRTGEKDYKKAFEYYSRAAENGNLKSKMKVADMYKNGYYVEKDYNKYCELIEELYDQVNDDFDWSVTNDVYIRLAKIRVEQGRKDEAVNLLLEAKNILANKIVENPFFGDLNVMKWLIGDLYKLIDIDYSDMDLFDMYYVLTKPGKVAFEYDEKDYVVEAVEEGGNVSIKFGDKWYRDISEFFMKATINDNRVAVLYFDTYNFRRI